MCLCCSATPAPTARFRHALVAAAKTVGERTGVRIGTRPFFPAISDVSFFGAAQSSGLAAIAANTPMWEAVFGSASAAMTAGLPTVNIGPWGRDYHRRIERLDSHYAFAVLPLLLQEVGTRLFAALREAAGPSPDLHGRHK